jgi:hypothetical protein
LARFSNTTLVALGGLERNILIDELLWGEDKFYDMTWMADTLRTVQSTSGNVVTIAGGDLSVFTLNGWVSFGNTSTLYKITALTTPNQITLETTPIVPIANGSTVQIPIDISAANFEFRLLEHTATINDDTRQGVDISNIKAKTGASTINLDNNLILDTQGFDLTKGQMRILVNGEQLTSRPTIDSDQPPFYIGYISILMPQVDPHTPRQLKKQRVAFIVRSDGVIG